MQRGLLAAKRCCEECNALVDTRRAAMSKVMETGLATCKTLANPDSAKRGRAAVGRRETLALDLKSASPPSQQ